MPLLDLKGRALWGWRNVILGDQRDLDWSRQVLVLQEWYATGYVTGCSNMDQFIPLKIHKIGPASSRLVMLLHLGLNVVLERKVDMILESHKP